ncbi:hypothetical protein A2U01_0062267, partial [Trifolium medium]|nr:hypothetical protein [Trifolium medium]
MLLTIMDSTRPPHQHGRLLFTVTGDASSGYMVVGDAAAAVGNMEKTHREGGRGSRRGFEDGQRVADLQRLMLK